MLKVKYLSTYYSSLKNIAFQRFGTNYIVSETQSAIIMLLRANMEEGDKCLKIAAIRYFANGVKARRRGKDS
jgi:uncharacterized protein YehS (DUF1456 family)